MFWTNEILLETPRLVGYLLPTQVGNVPPGKNFVTDPISSSPSEATSYQPVSKCPKWIYCNALITDSICCALSGYNCNQPRGTMLFALIWAVCHSLLLQAKVISLAWKCDLILTLFRQDQHFYILTTNFSGTVGNQFDSQWWSLNTTFPVPYETLMVFPVLCTLLSFILVKALLQRYIVR